MHCLEILIGYGPDISPSNISVTFRSHHELSVAWQPIQWSEQLDIQAYKITLQLIETDSVGRINEPVFETNVPSAVHQYDFRLLQSNSKYRINVMAVNGNGAGIATTSGKGKMRN